MAQKYVVSVLLLLLLLLLLIFITDQTALIHSNFYLCSYISILGAFFGSGVKCYECNLSDNEACANPTTDYVLTCYGASCDKLYGDKNGECNLSLDACLTVSAYVIPLNHPQLAIYHAGA